MLFIITIFIIIINIKNSLKMGWKRNVTSQCGVILQATLSPPFFFLYYQTPYFN